MKFFHEFWGPSKFRFKKMDIKKLYFHFSIFWDKCDMILPPQKIGTEEKWQHSCGWWAPQPHPLSWCPIVPCYDIPVSQCSSAPESQCQDVPVTWGGQQNVHARVGYGEMHQGEQKNAQGGGSRETHKQGDRETHKGGTEKRTRGGGREMHNIGFGIYHIM